MKIKRKENIFFLSLRNEKFLCMRAASTTQKSGLDGDILEKRKNSFNSTIA
jgi:hypothetical protein